ncbi:hypothetical protein IK110_03195 [Candidatus Saccharibacteria bacterium]|nr:hypothetical protein [Candidatus Saccharibacteria bacterium]
MEIDNNTSANNLVQPINNSSPNSPKKKVLLILLVIFSALIILAGVSWFVIATHIGSTGDSGEEEYINYDEANDFDITGGEEDLPEDQSIEFLVKYNLSDEDIAFVEEKIVEVVEEYYEEDGYDAIYYNHNDVKVTDNGNKIFFTLYTDWADREIEVTIYLVNGEVDTVEIY